jgi:phospholipid/cholesterol/gamma-HCH transport system substrate-binding protein
MNTSANKEIIAGLFFIVTLICIVLIVFVLGAKTGIGEQKFYQYVLFNNVSGLKTGAPVRIAGVNVGSVLDIEFMSHSMDSGKRVKVTLSILSKYKKELNKFSLYTIRTEGLLGDQLIDIQQAPDNQPITISKEGFVSGQEPLDLHNLADDFSHTTKYFNYLSLKMAQLVDDLQLFARISSRTIERLEDRLIEGNLFSLFSPSVRPENK